MRAYSNEFRERVIRASERGEAVQSIAERLEVSFGWVYSLLRRYRKTGSYEALPASNSGVKPKLSQSDLEQLRQTVLSNPDATLEELKRLTDFPVSISTLSRMLNNRLKMPVKKNASRYGTKSTGRRRGPKDLERGKEVEVGSR